MENITENKIKFFAQYFWQIVLRNEKYPIKTKLDGHFLFYSIHHIDDYYLELRSIDSITDDECVEYYDLTENIKFRDLVEKTEKIIEIRKYLKWCSLNKRIGNHQLEADFFRSKSFLVPFMNLTTDQILEFGWAKIKE